MKLNVKIVVLAILSLNIMFFSPKKVFKEEKTTKRIFPSIKQEREIFNILKLKEENIKNMEFENYVVKKIDIKKIENQAVDEFLKILSKSESGGNYKIANKFRFVGKYQFGRGALKSVGYEKKQINKIRNSVYRDSKNGKYYFDSKHFTPEEQEIAIRIFMHNFEKKSLAKIIKRYDGKYFNGVKVTKAGILAAAHLGGSGNVKKYFRSGGRLNRTDDNGTSLKKYMKMYENFDLDNNLTFRI